MEDNNQEEDWSEAKAFKKLCVELFIRSIIYMAIMIAGIMLLVSIMGPSLVHIRGRYGGGIGILVIISCAVYVGGLMNRTGCEVSQLVLGISLAVIVSSLLLCGIAALMELSGYYFVIIAATGVGVIVGCVMRYKYGEDD